MAPEKTNATEKSGTSPRETAHRELAREAAAESIVLLKNDGLLPISACPVALFGAGAAATVKGGTGSGEVNERYSVTIEQGLANAGFTITTGPYLREYEEHLKTGKAEFYKQFSRDFLFANPNERVNLMANQFRYPSGRPVTNEDVNSAGADLCIYVIARQAGECADRKLDKYDFSFSQTEIDNLRFVSGKYARLIVVINAGGSMDISPLDEIKPGAVVYFCQQGMEGGNALADILTGAVTPSGCLASTWPFKYQDWPNAMEYSYLKGHTDFEEYREGIYVGYRYFDSFKVKPRYEFGYGLSYTDFDIRLKDVRADGADITATVEVKNTGGKYSGKKTVQLYVSAPGGKLIREYQSLAAFAKTDVLAPGESQSVSLSFALADLAGYDTETASYILEQGGYIVRIGGSSANTQVAAVLSLSGTVTTGVCMNVCKPAHDIGEIRPAEAVYTPAPDDVKRISVSASSIPCKTHIYQPPEFIPGEKTADTLKKLSTGDMVKVVCGTGMFGRSPAFKVQGTAGYTTPHLANIGVPNAALCDGPAGVRVQKISVRLKNGRIKPVGVAMDFFEMLPGILKKLISGNPDKGTLLYQYASAFPVGTSQAQTWNTELIGRIGKAIGAEMAEFGATFWLAPGMNIHRNPLCGRNFEYYSEDPFLTGKMAAAVTKAVQSYEGCYVTVKHYAANNQEDNRNKCDSRVGERTLREIYLRGFRIAVEEGGAMAAMTSYNKLNGIYTPNSYDLCTNLLRCEWGFSGVVMTDWLSTGRGLAGNGAAIKAGNDLIMPGGKWFRKMIKQDLKSGALNEEELRLSCARVLEAVIKGRTGIELEKSG